MDYNADGLQDVLVGSAGGKIYVFLNTGTPENFSFDNGYFALADINGTVDLGFDAVLCTADLDTDGYTDIIAGYVSMMITFVLDVPN